MVSLKLSGSILLFIKNERIGGSSHGLERVAYVIKWGTILLELESN